PLIVSLWQSTRSRIAIAFAQALLPVGKRLLDPVDKHILDLRGKLQRITGPDHRIAPAPGLKRAKLTAHAHDLCGLGTDRGKGIVPAQPVRTRYLVKRNQITGILRGIADLVRIIVVYHANRDLDARL